MMAQGKSASGPRAGAADARRRYRAVRRGGLPVTTDDASCEEALAARRLLGDLEADIMDILWRRQRATVRQVLQELQTHRELAYTTVMTVMTRLAEKGLLRRERAGKAHAYVVAQTREGLIRGASQRLVRSLIDDFGDVAVAAMVDEIERVDPVWLEQLRRGAGRRRAHPAPGASAGAAPATDDVG